MTSYSLKDDTDMQGADPMAMFLDWFQQAVEQESEFPNAMALGTCDGGGRVTQRMVLLKDFHCELGFSFYTNFNSAKVRALSESNYQASLLFYWKSLDRQVRIEGKLTQLPDAMAEAYFASRPRISQIGAWASQQSEPLESRALLEQKVKKIAAHYQDQTVPRPPYWSGFLLTPDNIELWQDGEGRLHDRFAFTCTGRGEGDARGDAQAKTLNDEERELQQYGLKFQPFLWTGQRLNP